MRASWKIIQAAALPMVCAAAVAGGLGSDARGQDSAFEVSDKNADGMIDRGEFHARQVEIFYFLDEDKEGFLVVEELAEVDTEAFTAADDNGDGKLVLEEFVNARFIAFEAADSDNDGQLSAGELAELKQTSP